MPLSYPMIKVALGLLLLTRAHRWIGSQARGCGAILMLHHVRPQRPDAFAPNRLLEVTPEFLDAAIATVKAQGLDLVSLDEAHRRLSSGRREAPFASFTLDDGYRDNLVHAAPIFRKHQCPYTIYVPSRFAAGEGVLWWEVLEEAVRRARVLTVGDGASREMFDLATPKRKDAAFRALFPRLRHQGEPSRNPLVAMLAEQAGFSPHDLCRDLCMTVDEVRDLSRDPLATIGAHTRSHPILTNLDRDEALAEIAGGRAELEQALGRPVEHFAYPVGDKSAADEREYALVRDLGFKTGVTTRKGLVHARHASTCERLPRVTLNGHFQSARFLEVFLSGAPYMLADRLMATR